MLRRVARPTSSIVLLASLVLACFLGCGGGRANAPDGGFQINIALQVEELDLPNGLHVVLHQERSATQALVYVRYYVGSKDDPQGLTGFAHLYEHLMFRGSRNTAARDYSQWLEDVGGEANAQTTRDVTDYHARVPPSALPRAIWLEADRMAYPLAALDEPAFARERSVVENELRQHYDDVPLGNLDAIAREAVFGAAHPYGSTTIGRIADLDRVTLAQARTFGGLYYRPNNATLVICGLFDVAATRALVTRYFGTIPPGVAQAQRAFPPAAPRAQSIAGRAAVEGPAVMLAWPAPGLEGDGADEVSRLEGLEGQAVRLLHDVELHEGANAMQKDLRRLQSVHAAAPVRRAGVGRAPRHERDERRPPRVPGREPVRRARGRGVCR